MSAFTYAPKTATEALLKAYEQELNGEESFVTLTRDEYEKIRDMRISRGKAIAAAIGMGGVSFIVSYITVNACATFNKALSNVAPVMSGLIALGALYPAYEGTMNLQRTRFEAAQHMLARGQRPLTAVPLIFDEPVRKEDAMTRKPFNPSLGRK